MAIISSQLFVVANILCSYKSVAIHYYNISCVGFDFTVFVQLI